MLKNPKKKDALVSQRTQNFRLQYFIQIVIYIRVHYKYKKRPLKTRWTFGVILECPGLHGWPTQTTQRHLTTIIHLTCFIT